MATANAYSIQLVASLLDGNTVVISPGPGSASTGTITEGFGGMPHRIAAGATDLNLKLGFLTSPKFLAIWADDVGISFKLYSTGGTAIKANPFAFLSDTEDGLTNVSEIWITNAHSQSVGITLLAAE